MPLRSRVEHASVPVVEKINAIPRAVTFLAILAMFVAAALLKSWGWVPLVLIAVLVGWFLFLTWPRLSLPERLMRVAVLLMVVTAALVRALPR
jgi:hypothetical protein